MWNGFWEQIKKGWWGIKLNKENLEVIARILADERHKDVLFFYY